MVAGRSRGRRRQWSVGPLAAALLVVVAHPVAASDHPGADDPADASDASDAADVADVFAWELEAARDAAIRAVTHAEVVLEAAAVRLRTAEVAVDIARSAGRAADEQVRAAEARLPDRVVAIRRAELELTAIEGHIRELVVVRDALLAELEVAREVLSRRAVRTFKTGRFSEVTGPVAVIREARDPGELARGLAELKVLTREGARTVREVEADVERVEDQLARAQLRRDRQVDRIAQLRDDLDATEQRAAQVRDHARGAEARLLAAMEVELAARIRVEEATRALAAVAVEAEAAEVEVSGLAALAFEAEDDEQVLPPDDRAAEIRARRRAYARAGRLSPDRRRTTDAWVCPVAGSRFFNDWAFPRTGDRRHEGTDMFAPRGTGVVAAAAGVVTRMDPATRPSKLGGITVTVADGDHRQYYAHLLGVADGLAIGEEVAAGDLLGWVGTTGNARGTPPHLHLGWYVDDVAVNPYASLAVACDPDAATLGSEGGLLPADASVRGQGWRMPLPDRIAR